ncbi:GntR family transcriptional regulator [Mesorhizobium sp. M0830]|uniref:GntR family transcriptional regulator n=1 Tax=Mesorhizobium sp. M0830 TaxID=2957008 RepID=UPI00333C31BC
MMLATKTDVERSDEETDDRIGLNRDSLADQIYAKLRSALMTARYEPGSRLSIRKLAATFNTSPTPVREAVMQLVREGALELRSGYQPIVPVLSIAQYIKIRDTRIPLERLAAELSTVNITDEGIRHIREINNKWMQFEAEGDWQAAIAANHEFHFTVYRASMNDILVRIIENLWMLSYPVVYYQYRNIRLSRSGVHPHLLLIDALERRSPAEAGEMAVRDLREGSSRIIELLNSKRENPKQKVI